MKSLFTIFAVAGILLFSIQAGFAQLPSSFDLRDVSGQNYVTSVKSQDGGTCWTHGAMAAMEGNLLMTGVWSAAGESGEPNLAEYHLDWWNGFNQHNNDDIDPPSGAGLEVHQGGDYRVTSAYLTRGEGAVRDIDGQSYTLPPLRYDPSYHYYYVRDIEWYVDDQMLSNIDSIKHKIMTEGVMGTCMCYDAAFISNYKHYQPPSSTLDPNHAIAIVGWDDNMATQAPQPGAWLCKNSWGASWGNNGYFWISYYDKHATKHPEMGAISFQNVEPMQYDKVYFHDYHGWRDTKADCDQAFNAFVAEGHDNGVEMIDAVSFFTAEDNVNYTVKIYDTYSGGQLSGELTSQTGFYAHSGFHTVDLATPIEINAGNDFYVFVEFSSGGHPYDRTSDVPVLLGADYRVIVESAAEPGQSFFRNGGSADWQDLTEFDSTANFCIKALSKKVSYLNIILPNGAPDILTPEQTTTFDVEIVDALHTYVPGSATLHYRFDSGSFQTASLTPVSGDLFEATIPATGCGTNPEFYLSADGTDRSTITSPADAPNNVYTAKVGEVVVSFEDNFETDNGWTTEILGASSGQWQRGVPVDDDSWDYDPATDGDGSGQCFLTENEMGNTDVDNGAVRLISPVMDMSGGCDIEYFFNLYLTNTDGGVDKLLVEINNDGGVGSWIEIASHEASTGTSWQYHLITEDDLLAAGVTFTDNMMVRFTANDDYPQSIVEAGVDGFRASSFECFAPMDVDGMSILEDAVTVVLVEGQSVTGGFETTAGETTSDYEIWLMNSSKALFQPDPGQYSFAVDIADGNVATYSETGDWMFSLTGGDAGQTDLTVEISHSGIIDYTSPAITMTVNPPYTCGDANSDDVVDVSDAVFTINYAFAGGTPPDPIESGDANCDGSVDVSDAVYIINYSFAGGSQPCDPDGNGIPDC